MGSGYQEIAPVIPKVPGELAGARQDVSGFLRGAIGQEAPGYPGQRYVPPPPSLMAVPQMASYLLGQTGDAQWDPFAAQPPMAATGRVPPQGAQAGLPQQQAGFSIMPGFNPWYGGYEVPGAKQAPTLATPAGGAPTLGGDIQAFEVPVRAGVAGPGALVGPTVVGPAGPVAAPGPTAVPGPGVAGLPTGPPIDVRPEGPVAARPGLSRPAPEPGPEPITPAPTPALGPIVDPLPQPGPPAGPPAGPEPLITPPQVGPIAIPGITPTADVIPDPIVTPTVIVVSPEPGPVSEPGPPTAGPVAGPAGPVAGPVAGPRPEPGPVAGPPVTGPPVDVRPDVRPRPTVIVTPEPGPDVSRPAPEPGPPVVGPEPTIGPIVDPRPQPEPTTAGPPVAAAGPAYAAGPTAGGPIQYPQVGLGQMPLPKIYKPVQEALMAMLGPEGGIQPPDIYWRSALEQMVETGAPTAAPGIYGTTEETLRQAMQQPTPVTQDPGYQARLQQVQEDLARQQEVTATQARMGGTRYGLGTQRAMQETAGRAMTAFGVSEAEAEARALESAAQRQMQAAGMGVPLGGAQAALPEAAQARRMQAMGFGVPYRGQDIQAMQAGQAGQLGAAGLGLGLGGALADIPIQRMQAAVQTGMPMWQQAQSQADMAYQEWMRTQPSYRPELGMALQYAMGYPFGAQAPQVAQSPWLSLLSGAVGGAAAGLTGRI